MPAKSRQKVRVAIDIDPRWLAKQTPKRTGPVRHDIWATAMRLTGSNTKGMRAYGSLCVTFPVESLTPEGRKELKLR